MNRHKSQMLLVISTLFFVMGLVLFNSSQVTEPVLAQSVPTSTPRRVAPTITPRRQAPRDLPFKAYLPLVSQSPLDSFTLIERDLTAGIIDINQATTYKFYALFQSPLLPSQYQSNVPIRYDGTGAFIDTLSNWDQLNAATQQTLANFLNPQNITSAPSGNKRPGQQGVKVVGCDLLQAKTTAHFVIWYSGVDPRCQVSGQLYVDTIAGGLEDAWSKYSSMGYNMPVSSTAYIVPVINLPNASAVTLPPGIMFPNNLSITIPNLPALAAHEFFHTVQWRYFSGPSITCPWLPSSTLPPISWLVPSAWLSNEDVRWWMEASAQWAQHEVYSNDQTYYQPIADYLNNPWQHMDTRLVQGGTGFPYGSFLFPTYLTETLPAHITLIKTTWERYASMNNGCGLMMPALQSALQTQGTTMEQVFPGFTQVNYSLAYPNQADFRTVLRGGADFRPNPETRLFNNQALSIVGPALLDGRQNVEHLGSAYVEFQNGFPQPPIGRALTITVDLYVNNPSADPVVKFSGIITWNPPTVISKTITPYFQLVETITPTKHYVAKAGIPGFDSYQWVALDLVNPQTSGSVMTYTYSAGVISPAVIYAGGNSKAFASRDGGASWITYTFPSTLTVQAVSAVTNTQGLVGYAGTSDLKLWKTTNGGQTFTPAFDFAPKVQGYITNSVYSFITVDPNNSSVVYIGLNGQGATADKGALYKSTDQGQTFGSDLLADCHASHNPGDWHDCHITSLAIDPRNSSTLWIGQVGFNAPAQAVMRSTNGGQTWQSIKGIMSFFTSVSVSKINSNVVWALSEEGLIPGQHVYRTADGGASWNDSGDIDGTLPVYLDNIVVLADPFNVSAAWEASGSAGLERSQDGNVTWQTQSSTWFHDFGSTAPQVLYGMAHMNDGESSIQWSFDGGRIWFNIGNSAMVGDGSFSVMLR